MRLRETLTALSPVSVGLLAGALTLIAVLQNLAGNTDQFIPIAGSESSASFIPILGPAVSTGLFVGRPLLIFLALLPLVSFFIAATFVSAVRDTIWFAISFRRAVDSLIEAEFSAREGEESSSAKEINER